MRPELAVRGLALAGVGWRLYLVLPVVHFEAATFAVILGVLPYGVALAFAALGRKPVLGAVAAAGALLLDLTVSVMALRSASSTAGVAIMLEPVVAALGVGVALSPAALAARWGRRGGAP